MFRPRSFLLALASVVLLGVALWLGLYRAPEPSTANLAATSTTTRAGPPRPVARAASTYHPLADRIRNSNSDARAEVLALAELVRLCLHALRQSPRRPLGVNAEFTAALTGANSLALAYIPPGHPAINSRGELCDRWHRPFLFNPLSAQRVEIRSAGSDGRLFTDDDITVGGPTGFEP